MEGYFPIEEYVELAKVNRNTAYVRVYRGQVDAFKDKNGRWFIYFSDETGIKRRSYYDRIVPEGYMKMSDWAEAHGKTYQSVLGCVKRGKFAQGDLYRIGRGIFIKNEAVPDTRKLIIRKCPSGYLSVKEWAEQNDVEHKTAMQYVTDGRIPSVKIGKYRYIKEDFHLSIRRKRVRKRCTGA